MIEEDFYATIKLKYSGEEIFTKVAASEEEDRTVLILSNPIVVEFIKTRGRQAYKMEPWLKTSSQDMFILNMDDVLTISESDSMEMICFYEDYVGKMFKSNYSELNREMGYLGTVEDTKKSLENLFKSS
tara:strand:- start:16408 stop:16794 length:387 start_codon:yes stop_codon:yes gene_type:complete